MVTDHAYGIIASHLLSSSSGVICSTLSASSQSSSSPGASTFADRHSLDGAVDRLLAVVGGVISQCVICADEGQRCYVPQMQSARCRIRMHVESCLHGRWRENGPNDIGAGRHRVGLRA
jgi:hypothetical protein